MLQGQVGVGQQWVHAAASAAGDATHVRLDASREMESTAQLANMPEA
jgi:hypothetical protein